jgi:hypothetical protein
MLPDSVDHDLEVAVARGTLIVVVLIFVLVIVLPLLALGLPALRNDDGLSGLTGERRAAALAALDIAPACFDHPFDTAMVRAKRVASVRRIASDPASAQAVEPALRRYEVKIRTYTLFALPYEVVTVREADMRCR